MVSAVPEIEPGAIAQRLQNSIHASEQAVLEMGGLIERIVTLATAPTTDRRADGAEGAFVARIKSVTELTSQFVERTRLFLRKQVEFARTANSAFRVIDEAAAGVRELTLKSKILALNLQIEAARHGHKYAALQVIGQEMVSFTQSIRSSSDSIVASVRDLSATLPRIEAQATAMDGEAGLFATDLNGQLESAQQEVSARAATQAEKLRRMELRNQEIIKLAQQAMSELQFQDPLAQDLHAVIEMLDPVPRSADDAPIARSAMGMTDHRRSSGDIELF